MAYHRLHGHFGCKAATGLCLGLIAIFAFSCRMQNLVEEANDSIKKYLHGQRIYERNNPPKDATGEVKGQYDIIGGAYRYIIDESRPGRPRPEATVQEGDSISFMFVGRVFTGTSTSAVFYTNIESVRNNLPSNPNFDPEYETWPTEPLKIKVGSDPKILKAIQMALIGCRAGTGSSSDEPEDDGKETTGEEGEDTTGGEGEEGNGTEDEDDGEEGTGSEEDKAEEDKDEEIESDEVEIYLPPDIGFGKHAIYGVPGGSTLLWEISDIRILKRNQ